MRIDLETFPGRAPICSVKYKTAISCRPAFFGVKEKQIVKILRRVGLLLLPIGAAVFRDKDDAA